MTGWLCNTLSDQHERVDGRLWPVRQKMVITTKRVRAKNQDSAQLSFKVLTKPRKTDHLTQARTLQSP